MVRVLLLIGLVGAFGCADDTPTSPTPDSVDGVWRIISIQPPGQPVQTAPVAAQYQIGFENDRAFLRVDCNTCTGPFILSGSTLAIGPTLACTRAACPTASFESAVVSMLSGAHEISATVHNLTLTSTRGTVLLQR
jgi:heat shock protein HslJ